MVWVGVYTEVVKETICSSLYLSASLAARSTWPEFDLNTEGYVQSGIRKTIVAAQTLAVRLHNQFTLLHQRHFRVIKRRGPRAIRIQDRSHTFRTFAFAAIVRRFCQLPRFEDTNI